MTGLRDPSLGINEVEPNLFILRAGGESKDLTRLMMNSPLPELLKRLRACFDVVVIDTGPAGMFPDADAPATVVDELVFVCLFNTADRNQARQTLARLSRRKFVFTGVVLNAMPGFFRSSSGQTACNW